MGTDRRSERSSGRQPAEGPRALALKVVRRVTERGAYSNLALSAELGRSRLSSADRKLAADLCYGTLRRLLILDHALAGVATRPLEAIDPEVLALLRLGAYQLLFSRVPAYAAVSETVELSGPPHRGFVNAVLRALSSRPRLPTEGDDDRAISARTGLVPWAVTELRRLLAVGEIEAAAAALASSADLCLRANTCRITRDRLAMELGAVGVDARRGAHHGDVLLVSSVAPAGLPGYREGWFAIQDEASALVTSALEARPGERVLDACAGPGGKAADLACRTGGEGMVVAADVLPRRAGLVRGTADRLGVPLSVVVQDARQPALRGPFDAVLVDAPCSGLGAARRRPELLWRPSRQNLAGLARLQVSILSGLADLLRPGGRLIYSVCTFPRAETDAAIRAFLAKRGDFEPQDVPGPDGMAPTHRLWPHRHGTDAMFYAGFRRRDQPGIQSA